MDKLMDGTISTMYQQILACITSVPDDVTNNSSSNITRNGRDGKIVMGNHRWAYICMTKIR